MLSESNISQEAANRSLFHNQKPDQMSNISHETKQTMLSGETPFRLWHIQSELWFELRAEHLRRQAKKEGNAMSWSLKYHFALGGRAMKFIVQSHIKARCYILLNFNDLFDIYLVDSDTNLVISHKFNISRNNLYVEVSMQALRW
jgi:hypothetical protein